MHEYDTGIATHQGPRDTQADHGHERHTDDGRHAWAVADGIGDSYDAARLAAETATAHLTADGGATAADAVRAAAEALRAAYDDRAYSLNDDNAVLVLATPRGLTPDDGYAIAWTGDSRAYALRPGGQLEQITRDHTKAAELRDLGHDLPEPCRWDHILTSSLRQDETLIEETHVDGPVELLLLCTDGLYNALGADGITACLTRFSAARALGLARRLIIGARNRGLHDNATALVIKPIH